MHRRSLDPNRTAVASASTMAALLDGTRRPRRWPLWIGALGLVAGVGFAMPWLLDDDDRGVPTTITIALPPVCPAPVAVAAPAPASTPVAKVKAKPVATKRMKPHAKKPTRREARATRRAGSTKA